MMKPELIGLVGGRMSRALLRAQTGLELRSNKILNL